MAKQRESRTRRMNESDGAYRVRAVRRYLTGHESTSFYGPYATLAAARMVRSELRGDYEDRKKRAPGQVAFHLHLGVEECQANWLVVEAG